MPKICNSVLSFWILLKEKKKNGQPRIFSNRSIECYRDKFTVLFNPKSKQNLFWIFVKNIWNKVILYLPYMHDANLYKIERKEPSNAIQILNCWHWIIFQLFRDIWDELIKRVRTCSEWKKISVSSHPEYKITVV